MNMELDLMDWKSIERNAVATINDHKISIKISEILLREAKSHVKQLGGKTLEEEEAEIKQNATDPNADHQV
jgi:hypothetical protein